MNPLTRLNGSAHFILGEARRIRDLALGAAITGGTQVESLSGKLHSRELRRLLAGRNVVVTGASSGIGRAVAFKVAAAGATAVLVARSEDKLRALASEIILRGGFALVYPADLSSAKSTEALLASLARDHVRIDVLVNNAGRSIRRAVDQSYERAHDFERTMALNYLGAVRMVLGALPHMRRCGSGHVINVSSASVPVGTPLFAAYAASKAALDAFTRVAAVENHGAGVHFTTVHMPLVRTPMIESTEDYKDAAALTPDAAADLVVRALITRESRVGTRMSQLIQVGHVLLPEFMQQLMAHCHGLLSKGHGEISEPTTDATIAGIVAAHTERAPRTGQALHA